jgi:hypothetical protein
MSHTFPTTMTQTVQDQSSNRFMYSRDNETEFAKVLWEIVHQPLLPEKKPDKSALLDSEYEKVRQRWSELVDSFRSNPGLGSGSSRYRRIGRRSGLSLDDFVRMLEEVFGYDILNRGSIHRLIHTANPLIVHHAKSIQSEVLEVISVFSNRTYEELFDIGIATIKKYQEYNDKGQSDKSLTETADTAPTDNSSTEMPKAEKSQLYKSELKLDNLGQLTEDRPNNLRTAVHRHLSENGSRGISKYGIPGDAILELLYEKHPNLPYSLLPKIQRFLNISTDEFMIVLQEDIESLNADSGLGLGDH